MSREQDIVSFIGFIDVAGHPALVAQRGEPYVFPLLDEVTRLLRLETGECGAEVLRASSDRLLLRFPHAASVEAFAPRFHASVQRQAATVTLRWALAAAFAGARPAAVTVNGAARRAAALCRAAQPGQVLLDPPSGRALEACTTLLVQPGTGPGADSAPWSLRFPESQPSPVEAPSGPAQSGNAGAPPWDPRGAETTTQWDGSASTLDVDLVHRDMPAGDDIVAELRFFQEQQRSLDSGTEVDLGGPSESETVITLIHEGQVVSRSAEAGPIEFGRGPEVTRAGLRVTEPSVSGRHCRLEFDDNRFWLVDTSTNGTLVLGDSGSILRVHQQRVPLPDPSGWIVLGRSRHSARIRYHVLEAMSVEPFDGDLSLHRQTDFQDS
jgi:hypothetical protein